MIKEGERKGHWQYKKDTPVVMAPVVPAQPEIKAVPALTPLADTQPEPIKEVEKQ
jgi:hypothetical protein